MKSYQYRKSHCGDKTILRPSYLHNGISYTGKIPWDWNTGLELIRRAGCGRPGTLRWRHNWRNSVSNHQPHHCLLNRLFRRRSKKTPKLRVTGLCVGNSPGTGELKWPVTRKMFPFDDVIMNCEVKWAPVVFVTNWGHIIEVSLTLIFKRRYMKI